MNLFLVLFDLITINCPVRHSGHSTSPFFGVFVPKIMYFFFLADHDRYPLELQVSRRTARGFFPFRLGRQPLPTPFAISVGIVPIHLSHRLVTDFVRKTFTLP